MKPIHFRILKTCCFAPPWIAVILAGLGYLFPGTWGGTRWGEIVLLIIAVVITLVIYWGLTVEDRKKGLGS